MGIAGAQREQAEIQQRQAEIQRRQAETMSIQAEAIRTLTQTISKYVDMADERMRRIEENLDGLIQAITREHSNGKSLN